MLTQTLAIIRNTFFQSIRQPVMLVLMIVATLAIIATNLLSTHTMDDDHKMMIDMGLATVFLCGTLVAAFIATNVISLEIENRTVLTVISKPVGRAVFIVGKFLGVAGAIALASLFMILVFMQVELHGTMQTARDPYHGPVILFTSLAFVLGGAVALWCNYFYGKVFSSTALCVTTPLLALAYGLSLMFNHAFKPQSIGHDFKPQLWLAATALLMALMVLTAVAVTISTRLGQVLTITVTVGVFLMGMLSDWTFGRAIHRVEHAWLMRAEAQGLTELRDQTRIVELVDGTTETFTEQEKVATVPLRSLATTGELLGHAAAWAGYALVPNFQVFWLSDAITQKHVVPLSYLARTLIYGLLVIAVMLALATILFQKREVG